MNEQVILVDEKDKEIGLMPKLEAHQKGVLHRAFSVFIINSQGEMLLQQRALGKYHSEGLWSNSCCSHPFPGENTADAAQRRLMEEMGINTTLNFLFSFIYKAKLGNGLFEHEYDHVYFGVYDKEPVINTSEVAAWKYISMQELQKDIEQHPSLYTEWFKLSLGEVIKKIALHT